MGVPGFGARIERWQAWEERSLGVKPNPKCRPDPETLSFWEQAVRSGPNKPQKRTLPFVEQALSHPLTAARPCLPSHSLH